MPQSRVYSIKINGIQESVDIVDSLLNKLGELEKRLNALSGKSVSVGGGGGNNASALSAEERVNQKIEKTAERIAEARSEEYKILQQAKSELKSIEREQKAVAAAQNLSGEGMKEYANTLDGMREKLVDMKRALGATAIDSPDFEKRVQDINALNEKIKQIEQSYGQFGRNVENYANGVAEGMQKLTITVNGTERSFTSAREALKTLGNELKTMAVQGKQDSEEYKELDRTFKQLKSTIEDVTKSSKGMDMLLDTMQGMASIASVGRGVSALFGFDNNEIQKSIQQLVALQNAMQGIETIRKQMTANEGIGKMFNIISADVDQFTAKITGAKVGINGLEASSAKATVAVKGLSAAMKALGVGFVIYAFVKAFEQLKDIIDDVKGKWQDMFGKSANAEQQAEMQMKAFNNELAQRNRLIEYDLKSGKITQEEAYAKQIELQNDYLKRQIALLNERNELSLNDVGSSIWSNLSSGKGLMGVAGDMSNTFAKWVTSTNAAKKSTKELRDMIDGVGDDVAVVNKKVGAAGEELVRRWAKDIQNIDLSTEKGRREFDKLYREMNDNKWLNTILMNLDKYIPDEAARAKIQNIINKVNELAASMNNNNLRRSIMEAIDPVFSQKQELQKLQERFAEYSRTGTTDANFEKKYWARVKELETDIANGGKKVGSTAKKTVKTVYDDTNNLRIRLMQDGLNKTLAEIAENERKEIAALKVSGQRKADAVKLIEDYYNKQRVEARRKANEELLAAQRELNAELLKLESDNAQKELEITEKEASNARAAMGENIKLPRGAEKSIYWNFFDDASESAKTFTINLDVEVVNGEESLTELYDKYLFVRGKYYDALLRQDKDYSDELYEQRKDILEKVTELERQELEEQQRQRIGSFDVGIEMPEGTLERYLKDMSLESESAFTFGAVGEQFKKMAADAAVGSDELKKIVENCYTELLKYWNQYQKRRDAINRKESEDALGIDVDKTREDSKNITLAYKKMVDDISRAVDATRNRFSNLPDKDVFGIVNISSTKKKINETLDAYEYLLEQLKGKLDKVKASFEKNEIGTEEFDQLTAQITDAIRKINDEIRKATQSKGNVFGDFLNSIMPYMQTLVNGLSGILSELSSLYNAQYESRIKLLEEENEKLQELYNQQEEIENRHKDNITAIEDEIANARGARREYLVDQYNAEVDAQRRAVAEKKRLDEEMRRNEEKQKKLEAEERKRQNKIQMAQAVMSQTLAILNAFATKPWIVGLAMGAMATMLTAAQITIMKKAQKESEKYGEGGLLVGKSHKQGGIKVLGGTAEVEGGEYVINKRTTALNEPVLEFVNRSRRKLDINDFITFYNGNQKQIRNNFKTKYADGGKLRPDGTFIEQRRKYGLQQEIRPVVQVVDIIDATTKYNKVQVLAGLGGD